jgi:hypothetical protein
MSEEGNREDQMRDFLERVEGGESLVTPEVKEALGHALERIQDEVSSGVKGIVLVGNVSQGRDKLVGLHPGNYSGKRADVDVVIFGEGIRSSERNELGTQQLQMGVPRVLREELRTVTDLPLCDYHNGTINVYDADLLEGWLIDVENKTVIEQKEGDEVPFDISQGRYMTLLTLFVDEDQVIGDFDFIHQQRDRLIDLCASDELLMAMVDDLRDAAVNGIDVSRLGKGNVLSTRERTALVIAASHRDVDK